jgi:hypothetical protein
MAENLKELSAKAPAAGSLPKEQKAFAEQLERRQAELNKARERYTAVAKAAEAEADEVVKDLEGQLSAVQAKIDERKKQVAEAARKSLSADQQKERVATMQAARQKLDAARKADEKASAAYLAHRQTLAKAEDELERLKRRSEAFERGNRDVTLAENRIKAMSDEVERLRQVAATRVVPLKPGEEDVTLAEKRPDSRVTYILGTNFVLGVVFFALVLAAPLDPRQMGSDDDDDEEEWSEEPLVSDAGGDGEVPFAAAAHPDASASAAATAVEEATARRQRTRGEESPLTV